MKILSQSISIVLASLLVAGQLPAEASASLQIRLFDSDGVHAVAGSTTLKGFTVQVSDDAGNGVADAAVVFRLPEAPASGAFTDGTHAAVAYTDQSGRAQVTGIQWTSVAGVVGIKVTATKGTAHAGILVEETLTATTAPVTASVSEPVAEPAPPPAISLRQPGTVTVTDRLPPPKSAVSEGAPSVSVINGLTGGKIHSGSKTKWIILAAVIAVGAGAGIALAGKSKSSPSSSPSNGVSIGGPSISVGAP